MEVDAEGNEPEGELDDVQQEYRLAELFDESAPSAAAAAPALGRRVPRSRAVGLDTRLPKPVKFFRRKNRTYYVSLGTAGEAPERTEEESRSVDVTELASQVAGMESRRTGFVNLATSSAQDPKISTVGDALAAAAAAMKVKNGQRKRAKKANNRLVKSIGVRMSKFSLK